MLLGLPSKRLFLSSGSTIDSALDHGDHDRYTLKSNTFAYAIMIVLLFRYEYMGCLLAFPGHNNVSIIEFLITSSFLILPILYMSIFIGHYSKFGCFVFGRIVPLTYGVGYTMLIITTVQAVYSLIIACDSLAFLHMAITSNLPWMECKETWGSDCIGLQEMDKCAQSEYENDDNCFKNITQLSTYKYRVYVLQQFTANTEEDDKVDHRFWNKIDGKRIGYLLLCVIASFFFADLSISANTQVTVFIFLLYFFAMIFFSVVNFIPLKNYDGVFDIFKVTKFSLFDIQTWFDSISYLATVINLATVGPILIGSYLPKNSMADLQAFIIWLGVMILYLLGEFMNGILRAALAAKLNTPRSNLKVQVGDSLSILFPQFYGSLHFSPTMITIIFLTVIIITSLYHVKLLLAVCYHTLADAKPVIRAYQFYIRIFSCFLLMILAFPVCIVNLFKTYFLMLTLVEECLTAVVLVIICIAVLYVYGTQTLFDDHHFTYGSQPAIYFKITLLATPAILIVFGAILFVRLNHFLLEYPGKTVYVGLIISVCLFPQIIGLLYIMTYYLKRQDMAHLLRCEENWGDPNPQTRKERIIYHPRKETNYFRRTEVCKQHKCLRHNKIHSIIVKTEDWLHKDAYKHLIANEISNAYLDSNAVVTRRADDSLSSIDTY